MQIELYDFSGNNSGSVDFDSSILGDKVRVRLIHQAVKMYEANKRMGTAHAKTRSEVAGSHRKPWRQKGTGRARAGRRQSPIWVGGGVVFGPRRRDYSLSMPRKARRHALKSALLSKFQDNEVLAFTGFELERPATKSVAQFICNAGLEGRSVLFVTADYDRNAYLSVRNIPRAHICKLSDLNTYDVMRYSRIVFSQPALEQLAQEAAK
ncbi:MAG: 50S ribosomal protein L4 [Planctomycetota bacterium]|nr:50S ribosomal protein L4 [Planctomycetota bacterium]